MTRLAEPPEFPVNIARPIFVIVAPRSFCVSARYSGASQNLSSANASRQFVAEWQDQKMRAFNQEFKKIFKQTQQLLGPREPSRKIMPIQIEGDNYPETTCDAVTREVTIRVTTSTITYPQQRTYQLRHESVHCLSPRNRPDTLFFEEGLANWYALTHRSLPSEYRQKSEQKLDPLLAKPYKLFCALVPTYQQIAALRTDCPVLDDVTSELIIKHFSAAPELAAQLMERLPKNRPSVMY